LTRKELSGGRRTVFRDEGAYMAGIDKIEDLFSADHRYRDEIKQWQEAGAYPEEVVREYETDGEKHKDIVRMTQLGYSNVHEELTDRRMGRSWVNNATEGIGSSLTVTYRKKSIYYESDEGSNAGS
jgi:hypothetical protein